MSRLADHRALVLTTAATAVALAALLALGLAGGPGEPNGCFETMRPNCFCERPRPGLVAQPANTFSNLGFVAVGLALAALADHDRRRGSRSARGRSFDSLASPLRGAFLLQALFAVVTALLGPGSMALHASFTRWGGDVDVASMYLYASLLVAYGVARAYALSVRGFVALYAPLACLLVASKLASPWNSDVIFGGVLAVAGASDALAVHRRRDLVRDRRFLLAALTLFAVASAIWSRRERAVRSASPAAGSRVTPRGICCAQPRPVPSSRICVRNRKGNPSADCCVRGRCCRSLRSGTVLRLASNRTRRVGAGAAPPLDAIAGIGLTLCVPGPGDATGQTTAPGRTGRSPSRDDTRPRRPRETSHSPGS